ncbi:hypothetical protein BFW87_00465 [Pseudomonas fluorescens]|uniref:EAL domain-containing protein n=2 Tax=Pseudomonas fluorescens TaxID=294 RepID=A0A1T2Z900_PSEFL|nr:hypothetical protein BFW87_00465 [Pseudomonas fluorescens]
MPKPFPLRILVIASNAFQRTIAVTQLFQLGCHEVLGASDGQEAWKILQEKGRVDVAMFDLSMKSLKFIKDVGQAGLANSVIISGSLQGDLRGVMRQITSLQGLRFLGDISYPLQSAALEQMLHDYMKKTSYALLPASSVELASDEDMRVALLQNQVVPYFQPKFNLVTGHVSSFEVLARWHHPVKGILPPSIFIPVLKRLGLMKELLYSQLQLGLSLQKQAWERGHAISLAFNLETELLTHEELISRVMRILKDRSMPGSGLTFELTETDLLEISPTTLESLVCLRIMGCGLSIDDFGAGFSALQRLCQLPFNEIKLDSLFTRGLEYEPRCRAVVSSTLALGRTLGMSVVVEGVETEVQRRVLVDLGCSNGQGYLCAKPMPAAQTLDWLEKRTQLADTFPIVS